MQVFIALLSRYRRRLRFIAVALVFIFILLMIKGCAGEPEQVEREVSPLTISTLEIRPGILQNFEATGTVEAMQSANIVAEFPVTILDIYVREGEVVTEGQELLALESRSVEESFDTASALYTTAVAGLNQARISADRTVDEAEVALKTAEINLDQLRIENAAKRTQAEETLKAERISFDLSQASAKTDLENAIRDVRPAYQSALTVLDELLEFTQNQYTTDYTRRHHVGSRDLTQKDRTRNALIEMRNTFREFEETYEGAIEVLTAVDETLGHMLTMLQFNSTTSTQYTPDDLNNDVAAVNEEVTDVRSLLSTLEMRKRSLDVVEKLAGSTSQELIDAEAAYATTIAGLEASEQKALLELERAESALESARAAAVASTISARTSVESASGELDQAQISLDELTVTAPFDGIVVSLPGREGQEIQLGERIAIVENAEQLKVVTSVSGEQASALQTQDTATTESGIPLEVTSIAPSADPSTKKYRVELLVREGALQPGQFVRVSFTTQSDSVQDTRIFVPVTAVHVSAAETFVWGVDDAEDQITSYKIPVEIGNVSGKFIEILDGLLDGDLIVSDGGRSIEREGQSLSLRSGS